MLIKYGRIAFGSTVRWVRKSGTEDEEAQVDDEQPIKDEGKEAEGDNAVVGQQGYSPMLSCLRCHEPQETKWMQLRTQHGYRAIHCKACKRQQRVAYNKCQCGKIWHHCELHGVDPKVHYTRKAINKSGAEAKRIEKQLDSKRKAPKTIESGNRSSQCSKTCTRKRIENKVIRHVKFVKSQAGPKDALLQKLRARIEHRKANDEAPKIELPHARSHEIKANEGWSIKGAGSTREAEVHHRGNQQSRTKLIEGLTLAAKEQKVKKHAKTNKRNSSAVKPKLALTLTEHQGVRSDSRTTGVKFTIAKGEKRGVQAAVDRLLACRRKPPVQVSLRESPERHLGV